MKKEKIYLQQKFFSCLLGMLIVMGMHATPIGNFNLVVELNNGNKQSFMLSTHPVVYFEKDKFIVTQPASKVEFEISEVVRFSFSKIDTGINKTEGDNITISYMGGQIIKIYGVKDLNNVNIAGVDGKIVPSHYERFDDGALIISLEGLLNGVYIVTINGKQNFKIVKR